MKINEKIKSRRQELGLTLEEVGNYVGVSKATVQRYEDGEIKSSRDCGKGGTYIGGKGCRYINKEDLEDLEKHIKEIQEKLKV